MLPFVCSVPVFILLFYVGNQRGEAAFWSLQKPKSQEIRQSSVHRGEGQKRKGTARVYNHNLLSVSIARLGMGTTSLISVFSTSCTVPEPELMLSQWFLNETSIFKVVVTVVLMRSHRYLLAWSPSVLALQSFGSPQGCVSIWKVNSYCPNCGKRVWMGFKQIFILIMIFGHGWILYQL